MATNHLGDFGNRWVTRDSRLVGGSVQEVRDRRCVPFPNCPRHRCRHYFLQHLASVVNNNSKQGHDLDVSEKNIQLHEYEHRSRTVSGLLRRFKSRSTPTNTPPSDWISGVSRCFMTTWTPGQTLLLDLQPTLGSSGTFGSRAPVSPAQNHLRAESSLLSSFLQRLFPGLHQKLWHTVTEPSASTLLPGDASDIPPSPHDSTTVVPYLTFPTVVGKNSSFHDLTQQQLEELGGIEFRALNMLMWAVPLVRRTSFLVVCHLSLFSIIFSRWQYPLLYWRHTCHTPVGQTLFWFPTNIGTYLPSGERNQPDFR